MKINSHLCASTRDGVAGDIVKGLFDFFPENERPNSRIFMITGPEKEIGGRVNKARKYLHSHNVDIRIASDSGPSNHYEYRRYVEYEPCDYDRANYFWLLLGGEARLFAKRFLEPPLRRVLAGDLAKNSGSRRSILPDIVSTPQYAYSVSYRMRNVLENAGFVGLRFGPLPIFEGDKEPRSETTWEACGLDPYSLLASEFTLPPRSEKWTSMETATLQDSDDLRFTAPVWKYNHEALLDIEPFDIAMAHDPLPLASKHWVPDDYDRPLIISRRFRSLCESEDVNLDCKPVFVLDENSEPIVY